MSLARVRSVDTVSLDQQPVQMVLGLEALVFVSRDAKQPARNRTPQKDGVGANHVN